jgi:hypothetical protein
MLELTLSRISLSSGFNNLLKLFSNVYIADVSFSRIAQIEHSRHRRLLGFMVNMLAGLIAYFWKTKKPSLNLRLNPDFSEGAASQDSFQTIIFL